MSVSAAMCWTAFYWIWIGQLNQVDLPAVAKIQPGTGIRQCRPMAIALETQHTHVELECPVGILHQHAGVVKPFDYTFIQSLYPKNRL